MNKNSEISKNASEETVLASVMESSKQESLTQKSTDLLVSGRSTDGFSCNKICSNELVCYLEESIRDQIITNLNRQLTMLETNETLCDPLRSKLIEENSRLMRMLDSLPRISKTIADQVENDKSSQDTLSLNQSIGEIKQYLHKLTDFIEISLIKQSNDLFKNCLIQTVDRTAEQSTAIETKPNLSNVQAITDYEIQSNDVDLVKNHNNLAKSTKDVADLKVKGPTLVQETNVTEKQIISEQNECTQSDQIENASKANGNSNDKPIESKIPKELISNGFGKSFTIKLRLKNVKNFFEYEDCDYSPTFKFVNINWFVAFYSQMPSLLHLNFNRRLGVYLQCKDNVEKPISVKVDLILLNQTSGHKNKVRSFEYTYSRRHGFGWPSFISYDRLVQNEFINEDSLLFQLFLWII